MDTETQELAGQLSTLEGRNIAGRFLLDRMLGRGGFGAVYEALQLSIGRHCVVKVLVPNALLDHDNIGRFEREARLTSKLAHPNTVVIYDFGIDEASGLLFLAMEHIDGCSIHELVERRGALPIDDVVHIVHQSARSLHDAHEHGMVHRDVKPRNIMVTTCGGDPNFVKVIDFGIARYRDTDREARVTKTGVVIGSPAFMAPEQVRGSEPDPRVDQYALALTAVFMLLGRPLFHGDSPYEVAMKQVSSPPLPLRMVDRRLRVSDAFENAILRALAKDPAERFPSILAFANELARASGMSHSTIHDLNESPPTDRKLVVGGVDGHAETTDLVREDGPVTTIDMDRVVVRPAPVLAGRHGALAALSPIPRDAAVRVARKASNDRQQGRVPPPSPIANPSPPPDLVRVEGPTTGSPETPVPDDSGQDPTTAVRDDSRTGIWLALVVAVAGTLAFAALVLVVYHLAGG